MFKPVLETSFLVDIRFRLPFRCKLIYPLYNDRCLSFFICQFFELILTLPTTNVLRKLSREQIIH
jgi:hypothetical protein